MNRENKTLKIFVFDSIKISDAYKKNGGRELKTDKPVFVVFTDGVLEALFSGIQNFARPPTVQFNFLTTSKSHFA